MARIVFVVLLTTICLLVHGVAAIVGDGQPNSAVDEQGDAHSSIDSGPRQLSAEKAGAENQSRRKAETAAETAPLPPKRQRKPPAKDPSYAYQEEDTDFDEFVATPSSASEEHSSDQDWKGSEAEESADEEGLQLDKSSSSYGYANTDDDEHHGEEEGAVQSKKEMGKGKQKAAASSSKSPLPSAGAFSDDSEDTDEIVTRIQNKHSSVAGKSGNKPGQRQQRSKIMPPKSKSLAGSSREFAVESEEDEESEEDSEEKRRAKTKKRPVQQRARSTNKRKTGEGSDQETAGTSKKRSKGQTIDKELMRQIDEWLANLDVAKLMEESRRKKAQEKRSGKKKAVEEEEPSEDDEYGDEYEEEDEYADEFEDEDDDSVQEGARTKGTTSAKGGGGGRGKGKQIANDDDDLAGKRKFEFAASSSSRKAQPQKAKPNRGPAKPQQVAKGKGKSVVASSQQKMPSAEPKAVKHISINELNGTAPIPTKSRSRRTKPAEKRDKPDQENPES